MTYTLKTVILSELPKCDVCKIEFPNSVPNIAHYDAPIGGPWGYLCNAHKSYATGLGFALQIILKK